MRTETGEIQGPCGEGCGVQRAFHHAGTSHATGYHRANRARCVMKLDNSIGFLVACTIKSTGKNPT